MSLIANDHVYQMGFISAKWLKVFREHDLSMHVYKMLQTGTCSVALPHAVNWSAVSVFGISWSDSLTF